MNQHDHQYSDEAQERNLEIIWECDTCGDSYTSPPGVNEGGPCARCEHGQYKQAGEIYDI